MAGGSKCECMCLLKIAGKDYCKVYMSINTQLAAPTFLSGQCLTDDLGSEGAGCTCW